MDLLYLESVLHTEGIATEFSPTRPGGLLDPWGCPIRSQMFVDTAKLAEARQIVLDLLPTGRNDQGGPGAAAGQSRMAGTATRAKRTRY